MNGPGGMMAARILLVDNDKDRRASLGVILKSSGYLVFEAADNENALSLLAGERFDLTLLDITLPDRSGLRVLQFLKENYSAGKVIVITGTTGLENAIKSATPESQEYITKPYDSFEVHRACSFRTISDKRQTPDH
jgi:DNA-binding response OmpR family regulator